MIIIIVIIGFDNFFMVFKRVVYVIFGDMLSKKIERI